jgi:flavin-dependent dehydrogenase
MKEIKILGAGISGLAAAITLADAGYSVNVFERFDTCGKRFGGDLQGIENWSSNTDAIEELKSIGIDTDFHYKRFDKISLTNGDRIVKAGLSKPLFYVVKRGPMKGSLDYSLMQQALKKGVKIIFNSKATEKDVNIVATGPSHKGNIPGIVKGIVFDTKMKNTAVALLNTKAAYLGYAYLLVVDGYGCICTVATTSKSESINNAWDNTFSTFKKMFNLDIANPRNVSGIGCFNIETRFRGDGVLNVGEAAGIQDFLWGFGIRSAIISGYCAAKSISTGENYEKLVKQRLGKYMYSSIVNRFVWEKLGLENVYRILERLAKAGYAYGLIKRLYNYPLYQRALFPVAKIMLNKDYPKL